ncbi:hypothetical protein CEB3_c19440 [Peptococcaceae bacterium CEB3]|nr:hypothetical protein CEB3_c19440 [Peptococcaceae bacterium CEB3]
MQESYKIEIMATPNSHDNSENPYFWAILQYVEDSWVNTGYCDWAETPSKAFNDAKSAYESLIETK